MYYLFYGVEPTVIAANHAKVWPFKISYSYTHTAINFVSISAKFAICTVVGLNGTLRLKYAHGTLECVYFSFNKCPI
jgi:hypothetical protein